MPRGGKRKGSGRKKVKPEGRADRQLSEKVLDSIPEIEYWQDLIQAECQAVVGKGDNKQLVTYTDKRLRLEVLKYLTDKRDGKPPQAIHHSGPSGEQFRVIIEHVGPVHSASAKTV